MTREEIVEGLKLLEDNMVYYDELQNDKGEWIDVHELLFEAIQALEQEPCTDAVSRKVVLDAIRRISFGQTDVVKVSMMTEDYVKKLPSVTPQKSGKWIPVNKGLPEDKTYVLTTIKVPNRIAHARSSWYEGGFFHNDNGDTWRATDMEVKAWMTLPQPYEP